MKRLTYLITLLGLLLASCTDEDTLGTPLTGNDDKTAFQFSVNMPEYTPALTRAATDENAVNDLWLMTFDANGLFIGRAHASLLSSEQLYVYRELKGGLIVISQSGECREYLHLYTKPEEDRGVL